MVLRDLATTIPRPAQEMDWRQFVRNKPNSGPGVKRGKVFVGKELR